jgi:hypothetical protein
MIRIHGLWVGCLVALLVVPASVEGQRRRVAFPLFGGQVVLDTMGSLVTVDARPGETFAAVSLVLANVGLKADVRDSAGGMIGNVKLVRSRQFNRTPLSVFFDCGSSMTGLRADYYRVTMPLLVMLDSLGADRTTMRIALVASAQDPTGSSNQPVLCGSTGVLEARLRKAIVDQIQQLKAARPG